MDTRRTTGFTTIELMVTISIVAILLGIAVPTFASFSARQRLRAASFDLRTDLVLARNEALKRNRNVTVRPLQAAGWQTGWVVIVEDTGTELRTRRELGPGVEMDVGAGAITFNGSGRVASPAGTVQIDLTASSAGPHGHRCMVLDPSGMPRAYAEACS